MIVTGSEYLRLPREELKKLSGRPKRHSRLINDLKRSTPCADCGNKFHPVCMDFDHRPGTHKLGNIAALADGPLRTLEKEIAKCDIVCSNCHRLRTWVGRRAGVAKED